MLSPVISAGVSQVEMCAVILLLFADRRKLFVTFWVSSQSVSRNNVRILSRFFIGGSEETKHFGN